MIAVAYEADVVGIGLVCPVGLDAPSALAATRAGVTRCVEGPLLDQELRPFKMALLPDDVLPGPSLPSSKGQVGALHQRLVRLLGMALGQLAAPLCAGAPAFLSITEPLPGGVDPIGQSFLEDVARQAGVRLETGASRLFREGGAGSFHALAAGLTALRERRTEVALVGGADSFLDAARIAALDAEGRVLREDRYDGFVPGEGAAVLALATPERTRRERLRPIARIAASATGDEPGHRYSKAPYLGEGLASTVQALLEARPKAGPIRSVYAGLNGEGLHAKEWGVTSLRIGARLAPDLRVDHPADCYGDTGAAAGALLLALAATAAGGPRPLTPTLVWAASDRAPRGAALVERAT